MDPVEQYSDLLACLANHAKENPPSKLEQKSFEDEILTPYFSNCLQNDKMAHETFMVEESEEPEIETLKWAAYRVKVNLMCMNEWIVKWMSESIVRWMN